MLKDFMLVNNVMIHVVVMKPRRGVESTGRWWSVVEPLLYGARQKECQRYER